MTDYLNTAESGLANGTAVTTSNSGGTAGTGFTVVKAGAGTLTIDTSIKHRGNASYKADAPNATVDVARADITINSPNAALEPYYYCTGYPSTETRVLDIRASGASCAYVNINSTGQLRVYNAAGAAIYITTGSVPLSTFWRPALVAAKGTTSSNGTIRFAYYSGSGLDTSNPTETAFTQSGTANTGTVNFDTLRMLKIGSAPNWTIWGDDLQWSDSATNFIGPVAISAPVIAYTQKRVVEIDVSGTTGWGAGTTVTLTQISGTSVTITGPDTAGIFRVTLPTTVSVAPVLRINATNSGSSATPVNVTINADGSATSTVNRDFLVYNGTTFV